MIQITNRKSLITNRHAAWRDSISFASATYAAAPRVETPINDVHTRAAEDRLRFALGTKVRIIRRGQGGTIEVSFGSEAELNRIYEQITAG